MSTIGCGAEGIDIIVSLSTGTKLLLSQLVHTDKPAFNVTIASVSKQSGSADYGLYAVSPVLRLVLTLHCTVVDPGI